MINIRRKVSSNGGTAGARLSAAERIATWKAAKRAVLSEKKPCRIQGFCSPKICCEGTFALAWWMSFRDLRCVSPKLSVCCDVLLLYYFCMAFYQGLVLCREEGASALWRGWSSKLIRERKYQEDMDILVICMLMFSVQFFRHYTFYSGSHGILLKDRYISTDNIKIDSASDERMTRRDHSDVSNQAVKKLGIANLFTRSLPVRIAIVGPVVRLQWFLYDNIKMLNGIFHNCKNVRIESIRILAPALSPIQMGFIETTVNVGIYNSVISNVMIVSMGSGRYDVDIRNITCGPSHGIRTLHEKDNKDVPETTEAQYYRQQHSNLTFEILPNNVHRDTHFLLGLEYNISAIVDRRFELDVDRYRELGRIHLSTFFSLTYGFGFATIASTMTHVDLFYGREIYERYRASSKGKSDIYTKLMKKYKDIPCWWFYILLALTVMVSLALCMRFLEKGNSDAVLGPSASKAASYECLY
ncbi:oligopeptide transporter [Striga asiatica]|uniref:Oligopeptide transporter n=1 Tax=Striga asiatica TaxID=4170 RepID=A0A5A7Q0Y4_STRAF|nr:oligopeptide transporter [Striga asiatica]